MARFDLYEFNYRCVIESRRGYSTIDFGQNDILLHSSCDINDGDGDRFVEKDEYWTIPAESKMKILQVAPPEFLTNKRVLNNCAKASYFYKSLPTDEDRLVFLVIIRSFEANRYSFEYLAFMMAANNIEYSYKEEHF
jgi:hypothetical protein